MRRRNWKEVLAPALFAYRTAMNSSTKFSPFMLVFGSKAKFPMQRLLTSDIIYNSVSDYLAQQLT